MDTTCIGTKFDETFPQDQTAPVGAPDYVIITEDGWIIGTVTLDEMIEKGWDTGIQPDGTMIKSPYCIACQEPLHGSQYSICPACSSTLTF